MTPTPHTGGGTFPARRTPTAREIAGVTSLELPPAFGSGDFFKPLSGGMWIARTVKTRRAWAGGVMAVTTCHPSAAWLHTSPARNGGGASLRLLPATTQRDSSGPALDFFPQLPDRRPALSTQNGGWRSVASD